MLTFENQCLTPCSGHWKKLQKGGGRVTLAKALFISNSLLGVCNRNVCN